MRRHLQFSLRTFLLAVAIVALGLFWIRWPTMTASSFFADPNIAPGRIIVSFDALDDQMDRIRNFALNEHKSTVELIPADRTFMDVLVGVQHFDYGMYEITARRGKIALYGPYCDFGFGKIRR